MKLEDEVVTVTTRFLATINSRIFYKGKDKDIMDDTYTNFFGSQNADILIIGCDPTAIKKERLVKVSAPFDLKERREIVHYQNPYFHQQFRNLCVLLELSSNENDKETQRVLKNRLCITNAVGKPLKEKDKNGLDKYYATSELLSGRKWESSLWMKCFEDKSSRLVSYKEQLVDLSKGKKVFITSELLLRPFLKKEYRNDSRYSLKYLKKLIYGYDASDSEAIWYIPEEVNILNEKIYLMFRHYSYNMKEHEKTDYIVKLKEVLKEKQQ